MFNPIRMGASAAGAYEIENSLRFHDGDSTYLRKNDYSSPDSGTTFTFSAWVKLSTLDQNFVMFGSQTGTSAFNMFAIDGNNRLIWRIRNSSSSDLTRLSSAARFRDTSSWYHFVLQRDSTQGTAGDRAKLYANGVRITEFDDSNNDNENLTYSSDYLTDLQIGRGNTNSSNMYYADGYMAEIYYIDGQALPASNFGEFDTDTGQWIPKKYEGTYGSNGIYLNFSDNSDTTAATLGADSSGNGNNFTPNNFSVAAGIGDDSSEDTPTNNYCTLNPESHRMLTEPTNGNLDLVIPASATNKYGVGTFAVDSGKWYWECTYVTPSGNGDYLYVGVGDAQEWAELRAVRGSDGELVPNTGTVAVTFGDDDVIMVALDCGENKWWIGKNGSWMLSGDPANGTGYVHNNITSAVPVSPIFYNATGNGSQTISVNFGARGFTHTPPTGFKALCTKNLPTPTIKNGTDYFDAITYTATGNSTQNITGLDFSPNLVWFKNRAAAGSNQNHMVFDTVRGVEESLWPNGSWVEEAYSGEGVSAFNSNGVTIGNSGNLNVNNDTYVMWAWKESATAGFDIVSYTGTGSATTISHSLGVKPDVILVKNRDQADGWTLQHKTKGAQFAHQFNGAGFFDDTDGPWNDTEPTSSVFSVKDDHKTNANGEDYIAYLWSNVNGFSKAGDYVGNGNNNGPFIYTGFKPSYFLVKRSHDGGGQDWEVRDTARNTYNPVSTRLVPNENYEESQLAAKNVDFVSNGFKIRTNSSGVNSSGITYIYLAFGETPFKYATAR